MKSDNSFCAFPSVLNIGNCGNLQSIKILALWAGGVQKIWDDYKLPHMSAHVVWHLLLRLEKKRWLSQHILKVRMPLRWSWLYQCSSEFRKISYNYSQSPAPFHHISPVITETRAKAYFTNIVVGVSLWI